MRTNNYKRAIEVIAEQYEEARDKAFRVQFAELLGVTETELIAEIDEGAIQTFIDDFSSGFLPEYEWCENKFNEERGAYEDAKYTEMKEEGITG